MSFCFSGINSLSNASADDDDETSNLSSVMEDDLVTDDNDEVEDFDNNNTNVDDDDDEMVESDKDDISAISGLSNASSRKRMDSFIQSNAWNIDLEKLNAHQCSCKRDCTQNVSVAQIMAARNSAWGGPSQICAAVRRQRTFEIVASGNWITSRVSSFSNELFTELRFVLSSCSRHGTSIDVCEGTVSLFYVL